MSQWYAETEDDFNAYFDLQAHGISAVYTNSLNVSKTIKIILNDEYIDLGDDFPIEATQPMAYCRTIDVSDAVQGNTFNVAVTLDIDGNTIKPASNYTISDVQHDGTGITMLMLEDV